MALDTAPNFNPNTPIPNSPFYWPETNTIQGGAGVLVVGAGLTVNTLGQITTVGGGGGGTGTVTQVNTGVGLQGGPFTTTGTISLIPPTGTAIGGVKAGSGIAIAVDGTISSTRVSQVNTGTGLSGGPITSSGTISLNAATITTIGGVRPDNTTIIIQSDGTISVGPGIADSVNSVTGSGAITVDNTNPQDPIVGVRNASTSQTGVVALSNIINGSSQTIAATELAVSSLAAATLLKTGGTMSGNIAFAPTQTFPVATSTSIGVVQPDNATIIINGSGQLTATGGGGGGTGTVTAVNTGTGLTGGPITVNGTISLLASTPSVIGGVRPDGTTTTVDANGVISAIYTSVPPGGPNAAVQFNNNGAFGGENQFTYEVANDRLRVADIRGNTGPGSDFFISGDVVAADNQVGGRLNLLGGRGDLFSNTTGGAVSINGGAGGAGGSGGFVLVAGGDATTSGNGGDLRIRGGNALGGTAYASGDVTITPGTATGGASSGSVIITDISTATTTGTYAPVNAVDLTNKGYVDGKFVPAGLNTEIQFNNNGAFGTDPGLTYNDGALVVNQIQGFDVTATPGSGSVSIVGGTSSLSAAAGDVVISGGQGNPDDAFNQPGGNIFITSGPGQGTGASGNIIIQSPASAGSGGFGGVRVNNIVRARTQSPYAVTDNADLTTKSYVDGTIAAITAVTPGGTFFASSPSTVVSNPGFIPITTWTNPLTPNTLDTLTYNPDNGRFTNTSTETRTYAFTLQAAATSTQAIIDAYAFFLKNAFDFNATSVYGMTEFGRGTTASQCVLTTSWTFKLAPSEYVLCCMNVATLGTVTFGNATIAGVTNGNASTIIVSEVPGPGGDGNTGGAFNAFLTQATYNSGTNYMMNWPGTPSNIPSLSYSNGIFTNNTNLTRVYTLNYQCLVNSNGASGGRILEADMWAIVNNGTAAAGQYQRRGQVTYVEQGGGVQATFLAGSSTVTIQPGGTFGIGTWASISGGGNYFNGGPLGSSFLSGQSSRLTVTEVTNFSPLYQGGCLQNTQPSTAYIANTNTLLTFPIDVLDTNDTLVPKIINGVRVWQNSSTYSRTFVFDYTANVLTTNNIGLAAVWFQKNSTTSQPSGRFGMQTMPDIATTGALISTTAIITLEPNEYVTAWFLCDQSGTISAGNFGNAIGQGTRITITGVSNVAEGFNQFPIQYSLVYTSNNTAQSVAGGTFATVPANTLALTNTINASLAPITNNQDGTWTINQSGLYYIYATIDTNSFPTDGVATVFIQSNNVRLNSSIFIPALYAPYSLNVSGAFYIQAGDTMSLNYFNSAATSIANATISITSLLQG